ncbi:hypothetical protein [Streptomyces sp. CBMA291]|uniref:hypothetical protein n=1 Tax=unclassified Streptomyces TaxID=2593676 RepID=UPI001D798787|nr:hypothetical protein [Streptomyces sp. CBMA291]MBD0717778.1 hypothetical protein [Streptomyces sp. CBMA370]
MTRLLTGLSRPAAHRPAAVTDRPSPSSVWYARLAGPLPPPFRRVYAYRLGRVLRRLVGS